ncbi:prepilin-type N-terminal cleavage/methylation domain-containing protein [Xanthomonas sp. LMG 8992]|uniref:GspH/FimT family pseudopilin n=1 Tax=Xanthomonas sp. LMG 8992 TaxID=1591157 RepID=UPI00136B09A9|nr:Tfp pilus assembly protein FimT/FimU [Xanthomonas sp. LMG 8992]MXV09594.1 prepilin-type N-terminal cleavage/methylation domain-containing protein [Xanthomonas sp. LMG 8992]
MRNAAVKGYTLLEAMIVMVVICLVAGIGLPAFRELLANQRLTAATHQLSAHLALARSSAISSGVPVSACPSNGDGSCRSDSDWSQGWLVFRDPERQGQPTAPDSILSEGSVPGAGSLILRSNHGRPSIRFLPDGRSAGSNLTVNICERGRLRAAVVVNNTGRIRTRKATEPMSCRMPD